MSLRTNLAVIAAVAALSGCGEDGSAEPAGGPASEPTPPPVATASPEPTAEPTPTAEPIPTTVPTPPATGEEDAGDEDGNRVPVELEVRGDAIRPRRAEVPAFLGLRITLRNESGVVQAVTLDGEALTQLPPGGEAEVEVEGLKPGEHVLEAAGGGSATLVAVRAGG